MLIALWLVLAGFDVFATIRMLRKFGIEAEMNSMIRRLCKWLGLEKGVLIGILLPAIVIATLCWVFHANLIMAVLVGMRMMLAFLQVKSLNA